MRSRKIFAVILVLALATMACGINIDLPIRDVKTGPLQTEPIRVENLSDPAQVADVRIGFGAGRLALSRGSGEALVDGTATFNVEDLRPVVTVNGDQIHIDTGDLNLRGIPYTNDRYRNEWDLQLGTAPMNLSISAGAYEGSFELGGLALESLEVGDGAADVNLNFSEPNVVEMDEFRYSTGASNVELHGLANANFQTMVFKGGAGDYTLDFSGELKRDATITVDAGLSSLKINVPEGISARVLFDGALTNVDLSGAWEKSGNQYTQSGEGPRLTFNINLGAGNVDLGN
jgi:hypothetical protein